MATVRTSDRGILRPQQFRAFQVWLIENGYSVQEEAERIYWCSVEPFGKADSSVSMGIDDVCVTSYDLRETVRKFQDSLVKRFETAPVEMPKALSGYEQDLRDDLAMNAPINFHLALSVWGDASVNLCDDKTRRCFNGVWSMLRYEYADAMLEARKK